MVTGGGGKWVDFKKGGLGGMGGRDLFRYQGLDQGMKSKRGFKKVSW